MMATTAFAQSSEPQRFSPPVHIRPATHNVLRTSGTENFYGDEEEGKELRWQSADQSQRRGATTAQTDNAVYRKQVTDGRDDPLQGQLITDESQGLELSAPIDDQQNDRNDRRINLRTEHDGNALRSTQERRQPNGKRRAFAAGFQDQQELQDPYQGKKDSASEQDPKINEPIEKTCDQYRSDLLNQPITQVDINISAPRPTDKQRDHSMIPRDWMDRNGSILASGLLVDLRNGYAVVDTSNGQQHIAVARLSDADLAAISQAWRIPIECSLGDMSSTERCWANQTYTWKASNLCHKPLYFEDEQLERYGHSAGPVLQPLKSTAHFFVQLVTLPYQMGMHPPNECQYALGFYRPGNCAPWLCDPIPISLSGARHQVVATAAAALIIP